MVVLLYFVWCLGDFVCVLFTCCLFVVDCLVGFFLVVCLAFCLAAFATFWLCFCGLLGLLVFGWLFECVCDCGFGVLRVVGCRWLLDVD